MSKASPALTLPNVRLRKLFQKVKVPCTTFQEADPLISGSFALKSSKAPFSSMRHISMPKRSFSKGVVSVSLSRLQTKRTEQSQPKERPLPLLPISFPSTKYFGKLPTRRLKHRKKRPYLNPDDSILISRIETKLPYTQIKRPVTHHGLSLAEHSAVPRMKKPKSRTKCAADEAMPKSASFVEVPPIKSAPKKTEIKREWSFMQADL